MRALEGSEQQDDPTHRRIPFYYVECGTWIENEYRDSDYEDIVVDLAKGIDAWNWGAMSRELADVHVQSPVAIHG